MLNRVNFINVMAINGAIRAVLTGGALFRLYR